MSQKMHSSPPVYAANKGRIPFISRKRTILKPVNFAVIADPHVHVRADSYNLFRCAVKKLSSKKELSFIIFIGDLLRDGETENAEAVRNLLTTLETEVFVLRGNHDCRPADPQRRKAGVHYLEPDDFIRFFSDFGYGELKKPFYEKQVTSGLRLLALDACLPHEREKWGGILPAVQLNWLDTRLSSHRDQVNLVFIHHGLIHWSRDDREDESKRWYCIDNAREVQAVLEKNIGATPVAVSGHRHIGLHTCELRGINYFTVPPLLSPAPRYTLFTVTSEQVSWESFDLSALR